MSLPGDVKTITVTAEYQDMRGNPATGSVSFVPSVTPLLDTTDEIFFEAVPISGGVTGSSGVLSVTLPCTDQYSPSGWTWQVTESLTFGQLKFGRTYYISLPSSLGSSVDLISLSPGEVAPAVSAYLPIGGGVMTGDITMSGGTQVANVWPSGDDTGATDSAAIQAALGAAAAGTVVQLGPGKFYIDQPVVIDSDGAGLAGHRPMPAGHHGLQNDNTGTVLAVVAGFTNPTYSSYATGAVLVIDQGPGTGGALPTQNVTFTGLQIDGTASPASVDGFAVFGPVQCMKFYDCTVLSATGNGWGFYADSAATPSTCDAPAFSGCFAQSCGGHGFFGAMVDAVFTGCHSQGNTGDGYYSTGSNGHFAACRGDQNANGWTFDVAVSSYGITGSSLAGCSSQRNAGSAVRAINSSASGAAGREPVIISGCHFAADGTNGTSPAILASGLTQVYMTGTVVSAGTIDVGGGCPVTAVGTVSAGTTPGVPLYVDVEGGFLQAATQIVSDAAPSANGVLVSPRTGVNVGSGHTSAAPANGLAATGGTTVTAASFTSLASATIPPGRSGTGTVWKLVMFGHGTWGSTQQDLGIEAQIGGSTIGTTLTVDHTVFAASAAFRWTAELYLVCVSPGSSGTLLAGWKFTATQTANNVIPGTAADNTVSIASGTSGAKTVDTTSAQTLALLVKWASTTGSPAITQDASWLERPK